MFCFLEGGGDNAFYPFAVFLMHMYTDVHNCTDAVHQRFAVVGQPDDEILFEM